jgi:methylenetetrahydrofolate dehydrogenase (NADP+)/methenyltetrahydrofolate cyclohydrolase
MLNAQLMDGTSVAARLTAQTAERAAEFTRRTGTAPCLATVLLSQTLDAAERQAGLSRAGDPTTRL